MPGQEPGNWGAGERRPKSTCEARAGRAVRSKSDVYSEGNKDHPMGLGREVT